MVNLENYLKNCGRCLILTSSTLFAISLCYFLMDGAMPVLSFGMASGLYHFLLGIFALFTSYHITMRYSTLLNFVFAVIGFGFFTIPLLCSVVMSWIYADRGCHWECKKETDICVECTKASNRYVLFLVFLIFIAVSDIVLICVTTRDRYRCTSARSEEDGTADALIEKSHSDVDALVEESSNDADVLIEELPNEATLLIPPTQEPQSDATLLIPSTQEPQSDVNLLIPSTQEPQSDVNLLIPSTQESQNVQVSDSQLDQEEMITPIS